MGDSIVAEDSNPRQIVENGKRCAFKGDGSPCPFYGFIQRSGRKRKLCRIHFAEYNRRIAIKNFEKKTINLPDDQLKIFTNQIREAAVERTHKSNFIREMQLQSIEDPEIQRIAQILDRIKKKELFVIVPNAIQPLTFEDIKTIGVVEPITFGTAEKPYKRTMQKVSNARDYLSNVMSALHIVFPKCDNIVVKLLTSQAGDKEQDIHTDFHKTETTPSVKDLSAFHYSALVSFEANTRLICVMSDTEKKEVSIPLYGMLLFRGDFRHAGASYPQLHRRLFLSLSSESFPLTDDVSLHI